MPVSAVGATAATTCVSLQLITWPLVLPSTTAPPLPRTDPNPVPVIVTKVRGTPEVGLTLVMCWAFPLNATALLITPFCRIRTLPEADPGATAATTWLSLQPCTTPFPVPSHNLAAT